MTQVGSPFETGAIIGGYRIDSLLGKGGMGVVYLAEHLQLGKKVALKVLSAEISDDEDFRGRFVREARAAASLEHTNILPVFDAGESDGTLYLAMRYVEEGDLRSLLRSEGRLGTQRAVSIVRQMALALEAAHAADLLHRDVKPANILVGRGDHAYLADFGLARPSGSSTLTGTGAFLGSVGYCSPEQVEGKQLDGRSDIYSLGCVLYQCLAGQPPFVRDSEVAVIKAHLFDEPPSLAELTIPPALLQTLERAIEKDPDERFPRAADFAAALAELSIGDKFGAARPVTSAEGTSPAPDLPVEESLPLVLPISLAEEAAPVPDETPDEVSVEAPVVATSAVVSLESRAPDELPEPGVEAAVLPEDGDAPSIPPTPSTEAVETTSAVEPVDAPTPTEPDAEDPQQPTPSGSGRRRSRWIVVAVLVFAIAVAAAAAIFALGSSSPSSLAKIPSVVGIDAAQAKSLLRAAHLAPVVKNGPSDQYGKGSVYKVAPSTGSPVQSGDRVTIWVSTGAATSAVPYLVGKSVSRAKAELAAVQLRQVVKLVPNEKYKSGVVIRQSPGRSKRAARGTRVTLWVSSGKPKGVVPSVVNEQAQQAASDLRHAGFRVSLSYVTTSTYSLNGFVASQTPKAGGKAVKGSRVAISVWRYVAPTPAPGPSPTPTPPPVTF